MFKNKHSKKTLFHLKSSIPGGVPPPATAPWQQAVGSGVPRRLQQAAVPTFLTPTRLVPALRAESRPYRLPPDWFDQLDNHLLLTAQSTWFPG